MGMTACLGARFVEIAALVEKFGQRRSLLDLGGHGREHKRL